MNGQKGLYQLEMRPTSGCTLKKFKKRGNVFDQDPGSASIDSIETKVRLRSLTLLFDHHVVLEVDPEPRTAIRGRSKLLTI